MRASYPLSLAFICVVFGTSQVLFAQTATYAEERKQAEEKISLLQQNPEQERSARFDVVEKLARNIDSVWRDRDVEDYAELMLQTCQLLNSVDWGTDRRRALAPYFAMRTLEKRDGFSVSRECGLLFYVRSLVDAEGNIPETREARQKLRKQVVALWLHALGRVEDGIDPAWDAREPIGAVVQLPKGIVSGPDPPPVESIQDPVLKAQYIAAIEDNKKRRQEADLQLTLRQLKISWEPMAERYIFELYSSPVDGDQLVELDQLLDQSIKSSTLRDKIIGQVKNGKLDDDIAIPSTQPK
jgi:hypothetical protein